MSDYDPFQEFEVGEDDDDLARDDREKFQPQKDETYRVSMAWWRPIELEGRKVYDMDAAQPRMLRAKILYGGKGIGYALYKGPEYAKLLGVDPEDRIATVLVSWPIFRKGANAGKTDPDMFKAGRFEVLPLILSKHKYQLILRAHNTKPLGRGDLRITCTNQQYQHLEMGSYEDNYLRKIMESRPELFEQIRDRIEKTARRLRKLVGTDFTLEALREKMGLEGGQPEMEEIAASSEDFDDLIEGLV